jgi:hypothetical protein
MLADHHRAKVEVRAEEMAVPAKNPAVLDVSTYLGSVLPRAGRGGVERPSADVRPAEPPRLAGLLVRLLAIVFLFFAASIPARAQRYPVLPVPNSPHGIFTMMQDSHSRLWLGTIDDVLSFDGSHFYSLRSYGFPKEIPNSLAEDSDGGIWIATQGTDVNGGKGNGGLYRYQSGRFEKIFSGDALTVAALAPGLMLASFGTEVSGRPTYGDLVLFRKVGVRWEASMVAQKVAHHLTLDAHGTILFPCPGGWCEIKRDDLASWTASGQAPPIQQHPGSPLLERVLRDRFDCVWFRAEAFAAYQCPAMPEPVNVPDTLTRYDSSAHLEETANGDIFMLVRMILGRPGRFHAADVPSGLPPDMDTAMVGRDGTIWIGAESGLYRFMYPFQVEYWDQSNGSVVPYSVLSTKQGVFVTSPGLAMLSNDRSRWDTFRGSEILQGISRLEPGPGGTILAASQRGVAQFRTNGTIAARSGFPDGIVGLAYTPDGEFWFGGGPTGPGLSRGWLQGNRIVLQPENLPKNYSTDVIYDAARRLIWACNGHEVVYRDARDRSAPWLHISAKDGLLDAGCSLLSLSANGDLWEGYDHSQFALIKNPASDQRVIRNYTDDVNALVSNSGNHYLKVDRRGWVWRDYSHSVVATQQAAEAGDWIALDREEGLNFGVGSFNGFSVDAVDDSVWFINSDRIVHFNPDASFATSFPAPPIFVAGFSTQGGIPLSAEALSPLPSRRQLVAHIGSLQFDRRSNIHLRYRVLPGQAEWQNTSAFDIPLGKFFWGDHTLEVQAQMSTGPWSSVTSQTFHVLRPIWLSWPVLAGLLLGGSLASAGTYRWRQKQLARETRELPELAEWRVAALSPELAQLQGTLLDDRFEVGRIIARGGFATVTQGRDLRRQNEPCAIKIFRQDLLDNDWMTRRFRQEVLALEKIRHPNVVGILGHGTTSTGAPYLVMEFVDGETLRDRLEQSALTPELTASYLRQTGSALREIHAHGICHRDLKPENLMVRRATAPGQELVLIDFSIAIVQDPDQTLHGLSRAAGTLYYMAPEQSIGFADSSTDIYSLAKILIEMLTGKRLTTLLPDASMDLPERVRELLTRLPLELSTASIDLISTALEFDPVRRPKDAGHFATQIATDLESVRETI